MSHSNIYIYLYVLATNLRKSGVIEVNKKNGLNLGNLVLTTSIHYIWSQLQGRIF